MNFFLLKTGICNYQMFFRDCWVEIRRWEWITQKACGSPYRSVTNTGRERCRTQVDLHHFLLVLAITIQADKHENAKFCLDILIFNTGNCPLL